MHLSKPLFCFAYGVDSPISTLCNAGHLGGLFTGLALGYIMAPKWVVVRLNHLALVSFFAACLYRSFALHMHRVLAKHPEGDLTLDGAGARTGPEGGNYDDSRGG